MRDNIQLACGECKRRNYTSTRNKKKQTERLEVEVELIQPIAMDRGLRFAIREGGRTVGAGTVAEIVE